jgi:phosphatidylglycerol---prolipoprotein diacylglyceryl transferase
VDPIIHNIDPFLIRFTDGFGIRWYSIPYIVGMLLVYLSLRKAAVQKRIGNLTEEGSETFVLLAIAGALIGARFFHVFIFEFDRYGFDPAAWIAVWRGGLAFHGGLAGILLATWWFARKHDIPIYSLTDRIAVPVLVALGLGRIANFINAEMYGTPYDGIFCVDYSQNQYLAGLPDDCRHPTQLYESFKNFAMAGVLLAVRERLRVPQGTLTWSFVAGYGVIRFFLMYVREERTVWMDLTLSQIFSGGMGLLGIAMLIWVFMKGERPETPGMEPGSGTSRRRSR